MAGATTRRIAEAIVKTLDRDNPACTVGDLARVAIAATSTFRMWCAAVGIRSRDVLAFARGLWVVYWATALNAAPHDLLQFAEKRSIGRFILKSGPLTIEGRSNHVISVKVFCSRQGFVTNEQILADVLRLVADRDARGPRANDGS